MQIEAESGPIPMALVQNKVDLMDQVQYERFKWHLILGLPWLTFNVWYFSCCRVETLTIVVPHAD